MSEYFSSTRIFYLIDRVEGVDVNDLNLNCYCKNNLIMYADPIGHFIIWAIIIDVATVFGTVTNINSKNLRILKLYM